MASSSGIKLLSLLVVLIALSVERVNGQGRMIKPPQRSSAWRKGFEKAPVNYDDHTLWCGTLGAQYNANNDGKCGECGDDWNLPRPRPNDEGGKYGKGIIVATYNQGDIISVEIEITFNPGGWMEFRLCADKTSATQLVTQECLDKHLLQLTDGTTRHSLGRNANAVSGTVSLQLRLPAGVSCQYCVLQMYWKTDSNNNDWQGCNKTEIACGRQTTYANCADVTISSGGGLPVTTTTTALPPTTTTTALPPTTTTTSLPPTTITTTPKPGFVCPSPNGNYPDPNSCSGYYQCTNGVANPQTCVAPYYFDTPTGYCQQPSSGSGCNGRPFICPADDYYVIPGTSCTPHYYVCYLAIPNFSVCQSGQLYNPSTKRCVASVSGCSG